MTDTTSPETRPIPPGAPPEPLGIRGFERSLPMALMRARERVMSMFRPILAEHGLTEQQWRVLRALGSTGSPTSVGRLADETCLLGPSLSRMLVSMERRSLIERRLDRSDNRRAEVSITPAGIDLVSRIAPRSEAVYRELEAAVGVEALAELHLLLDRVADLG